MNTDNATGKGFALDMDNTLKVLLQNLLVLSAKNASNSKEIEFTVKNIINEVSRLREKLVIATKTGVQATSLYTSKKQKRNELTILRLWNKSLEELTDVIAGFDCMLYLENDCSKIQGNDNR